jgi:hypothetical protein
MYLPNQRVTVDLSTADLIAFLLALRANADYQAQYGGFCDAD